MPARECRIQGTEEIERSGDSIAQLNKKSYKHANQATL